MKKFLTMALALMMVLSLFAVPTMAADGHYLGEDLLGGKGTFEALDPDSYIAANGTDGFAAYDATITAQVVEEAGNKYVTLTPSNDTRAPGLYITRVEEVGEGSGNYLMPVTEGQRYAISFDAWYQGTLTNASWNTTINADTYFFDANGTQVKRYYYGFNSAIFASGIWGSYDYEIVAPAGAAYMRVQLALPKACGVFKLDNISVKTTDELVSSALQYGAPYGSFETFSTNDSQWVATGGYAMWHLNTAGSAVYKNTSTSDIFRLFANGDNLLDNTDENNGIMAQDGQMYVGIQGDPNATLWNAENVEATDGRVFFNLALDYDTTYEISVWFNAANAKDSYGEDELPLTPVLTINGEKAATRGQVRQAFTEAWKVDGWQKLTWEVTTPTAEWYTTQTGSGAATSAATVGFGCYGTEMGYFDNFSVVEKKAAPQPPVVEPTEYDVTITAGANANASVSAATSEGEAVNFTVAPKFGYYIQSITI
ncbi:MAG: hypothetical protein IKC41_04735, partial [Clostridia bacterium]|nr:hypothetical protein [Clostridia bacterium]